MVVNKDKVVLELGNAVYDAISSKCWDENNSTGAKKVSISSLNQSIYLLSLEVYLLRLGKSMGNIAANWSQLRPALMRYLKENNITLSQDMSARLTMILSHFGNKSSETK